MFHRLLTRMSFNFMMVLVIVLILLGTLVSRTLWLNQFQTGVDQMAADARSIATHYEYLYEYQITSKVFVQTVGAAAHSATVWLVDKNGLQLKLGGTQNTAPDLTGDEVDEYLRIILNSGEPMIFRGGFENYFGKEAVITAAMPLKAKGKTVGAVFIHKKLDLMSSGFLPIFQELWLMAMIASVVGLVMTGITAVRITKPLSELARAAKQLAQGDMSVRVPVQADDEIGELAMAFNSMVEALGGMEEMRRGFVANVSHELRSPITSIAGYLQGMLDGTIPEQEHQRYMQVVYDETQRLTRLVRDLLDLSRIEAGNVPMNPVAFNMNELMRRVLIKYEGRLEEKNMVVEAKFSDEPLLVYADPDRIEQVVSNLVDNAIKFCGQYGRLTLSTKTNGTRVTVCVVDDGAGISEKDLSHLFERFYKADKAHTSGKGTGLGLSIVRQILLQHGTDITATSSPGEGASFTFQLDAEPKKT